MSATVSRSEDRSTALDVMHPVRVNARTTVGFKREGARTRLAHLAEGDGYRVKLPRTEGAPEAVLINTGGGMVGGDRLGIAVSCSDGAEAIFTTQSAEKIYRSLNDPAHVDANIALGEGAALDWLPQETILFSGARLSRSISVTMEKSARLLIAEAVVFGRLHSGERLAEGELHDRWRVYRDGRLCFADTARFAGNLEFLLNRRAIGGKARAIATILLVEPGCEAYLETVRGVLATFTIECGASSWNDMLIARFAAPDPQDLRTALAETLSVLRSGSLPRVWQC